NSSRAQPAYGVQRDGDPLDLGLEDAGDGDPRPSPRPEAPGRPEPWVERRRRQPALAAESRRQKFREMRRNRQRRQRPGVDGLDLPQRRPQMNEPALIALAEVCQRAEPEVP